MGNLITNVCVDASEYIKMSNSLTGVVISLLALSGSALAKTEQEKLVITWFANHDQAVYGRGAVDFDLNEIPWTPEQFDAEKRFLLAVIRRAQSKQDWGRLCYEPREDWALGCLEKLAHMVSHFPIACVDPQSALNWQIEKPAEFILCAKHHVLLHSQGCVVCHDSDPV